MMHTNVTTRSEIEVWADDAMKVESRYSTCWGILQNIHVPLILSQYMPVWTIVSYYYFSIKILCLHKGHTSGQPI